LNNTVINTINVGKEPQYLLQHGSKIYVTNYANGSISVIDANRNSVIKNITVGESPRQFEKISIFSPYLYVLNENSDHISVINLTSDEVIKNITVGNGQYYFASTPKKLYTSDGDKISVVNLTTSTITKNITLDSPGEMKIYGDKLYAINYPNSISVINRTTDEVIKNITVGESPFDIISPYYGNEGSDRKLYVANFQSKSVSVINRTTDEVIKNITVGDYPNNLRSYLDALYVFGENTDGIYVIDMIKDELVAGVVLNVFPKNAGSIMCPDVNPPLNQFIYVHSTTKCVAIPNKGFEFLSWNEILNNNSTRTLMTSQNNNFILKSVADLFNIPLVDNNASLNMTQFGKFTANFRELSPPLPPEYLLGLYTLAATVFTGWFVPNIARHISTHRQKRHMLDYVSKLDKLEKNNEKVKILEETRENIIKSFAKGEISEIQYKLIMEKISDMKNNRT
jgi:YVTN family beta-propeller protein